MARQGFLRILGLELEGNSAKFVNRSSSRASDKCSSYFGPTDTMIPAQSLMHDSPPIKQQHREQSRCRTGSEIAQFSLWLSGPCLDEELKKPFQVQS
mmetsp:Transcript_17772/g.26513  ORF Transcript_17772/g.26513 Transcript_17772/m.26513 type:complete len:97 (-) Transcript_17772:377-667(-)